LLSSKESDEGQENYRQKQCIFMIMNIWWVWTYKQWFKNGIGYWGFKTIASHFSFIYSSLLEKRTNDWRYWCLIFIPEAKSVQTLKVVQILNKNIDDTKSLKVWQHVKRDWYIVKTFMNKKPKKKAKRFNVKFRTGFTAQRILIEF
jgi:hypothetical protein